ncbi:MAG: CheR family methyltransferase, partial [Spirochaetota bacterium]
MAEENKEHGADRPALIVGIGASAGGLNALKAFFRGVPGDAGIAYTVITHLHPEAESALSELIGREAAIPVHPMEDGVRLEPDHAYILTPGHEAIVYEGAIHLEELDDRDRPPAPVNRFFRSLAQDQRERAVGIILSGSGTDGTVGAEEIKGSLGMMIAVVPDEAEYSGMPQSAIDSGYIDHEVPISEMPGLIASYRDRVSGMSTGTAVSDRDRTQLNKILAVIRSQTGHDFSTYKTSTMFRRIRRRMNVQQVDEFEDYQQFIRQNPREADELFHELLIGVTSFFRDPDAFNELVNEGLPKLLKDREPKDLRVWVPGCSTGEEAYSLAMIFHEYCAEHGLAPEIAIFATDIAEEAIARARRGVYPDSIAADVGTERVNEHFERQGDTLQIRKHIRNMLIFSEQDITGDPPFTRLDLVSCRNLLIYLNQEMQRKLIPLFHYSLRDAGLLFLGTSETIGNHQELFRTVSNEFKLFQKRPDRHPHTAGLDFALRRGDSDRRREVGTHDRRQSLEEAMRRYLLEHHTPSAVFVTRKDEIIYVHGRTGRYLEPAAGEARMNIMDMAREGLSISLGTALRESYRTDSVVTRQGIKVKTNGDYSILDI